MATLACNSCIHVKFDYQWAGSISMLALCLFQCVADINVNSVFIWGSSQNQTIHYVSVLGTSYGRRQINKQHEDITRNQKYKRFHLPVTTISADTITSF